MSVDRCDLCSLRQYYPDQVEGSMPYWDILSARLTQAPLRYAFVNWRLA